MALSEPQAVGPDAMQFAPPHEMKMFGEMVRDWRLEASSGGITVELPPEAAFELDASTGSGSIDSERPVSVTGRISRKSLRGAVGTGGPRLEIETSSGSIVIR